MPLRTAVTHAQRSWGSRPGRFPLPCRSRSIAVTGSLLDDGLVGRELDARRDPLPVPGQGERVVQADPSGAAVGHAHVDPPAVPAEEELPVLLLLRAGDDLV